MTATGKLLEQHKGWLSVLLHLAPGAVALLTYLFLFVPLAAALSLPRQFAFLLMDVLVLLPLLLAVLLYLGRRLNGRLALDGVVLNRRKLPARQLAVFVLALFVWAVLVVALLSWVDAAVFERFFHWVPIALLPETDLAGYSRGALVATHVASIAIVGVAAPIVEELYFRGFLLPRMARAGRWAPAWHTVLFTCYHFWSPWRFTTRIVFGLPMVYSVWRTKSISIGIWWHCLGNVAGELITLAALFRAITGPA